MAARMENVVAESKSVMIVCGQIRQRCPNPERQWHISEYAQVPGNAQRWNIEREVLRIGLPRDQRDAPPPCTPARHRPDRPLRQRRNPGPRVAIPHNRAQLNTHHSSSSTAGGHRRTNRPSRANIPSISRQRSRRPRRRPHRDGAARYPSSHTSRPSTLPTADHRGRIRKVPAHQPAPPLRPVKPMLATPGPPPSGDDWAVEMKFDGVRTIATITASAVHLFSRNNADITAAYPEITTGRDSPGSTQAAA
ncbi:ATP dependent DNA ligase domain-containing protein [Rhodococcus jostii]|uniref:ATP dependent DNA ligase domain-containing protein n=2 Tax=Rhodococcus jostii TaxID=132919 RepID=A0A1H5LSV6_RHOJO|nr:ATP dependent DNA ligase domain-containing protein [Rhodococcus jostii]